VVTYSELVKEFKWDEAYTHLRMFDDENPINMLSEEGEAVLRFSRDEKEKITYGELKDKALRLACYLKEIKGVKKGDVIAVLASRKVEQVITLLACWLLGAIYQPLFTAFGSRAVELRIKDKKPKLFFTQADQKGKLEELNIRDFMVYKEPSFDESLNYGKIKESERIGWDDPILLLYTSGTTGSPKGILISKRMLLTTYVYMKYGIGLEKEDVYFDAADPGWAYGLYHGIIGPLMFGKEVIFLDEPFNPERLMEFLEEMKITNFAFAPTGYRLIAKAVKRKYDLRLRKASSAGEPLNLEVINWFQRNYNVIVKDHYGQTECGMVVYNGWGYESELKVGSMGLPAPGHVVDIIDEVIAVRVDYPGFYFLGYINAMEKVREVIRENWYLTGDVAVKDERGYFWFVGRKDDVVKVSGYRVGPFEIENVLLSHPAVLESAVVGDPDPVRGHILHGYVVLKEGFSPSEELRNSIIDFVNRNYGKYVHLERLDFIDKLPKTESGKIQRHVLKKA